MSVGRKTLSLTTIQQYTTCHIDVVVSFYKCLIGDIWDITLPKSISNAVVDRKYLYRGYQFTSCKIGKVIKPQIVCIHWASAVDQLLGLSRTMTLFLIRLLHQQAQRSDTLSISFLKALIDCLCRSGACLY